MGGWGKKGIIPTVLTRVVACGRLRGVANFGQKSEEAGERRASRETRGTREARGVPKVRF